MDDDKETSVIQSNKETQIILIDEKFVSNALWLLITLFYCV
jgi:hypothetical protein